MDALALILTVAAMVTFLFAAAAGSCAASMRLPRARFSHRGADLQFTSITNTHIGR